MKPGPTRARRRTLALVALALGAGVLPGCGSTSGPAPEGQSEARAGLPSHHVHGVDVNPGDGAIFVATHDGLFRYGADGPQRVGPMIDLMGFSVAGPDHFYASGHPGDGVDLPDPVGLIESRDGGRSWGPVSRQGDSDFHALAAFDNGVVGFDGTLRKRTTDPNWQELDAPVEPFALGASPDGSVIVATAETGPARSGDGGRTWAEITGAPLLMLVAWAGEDTVVGVTPDGAVAVSTDAGQTWQRRGTLGAQPQALGATLAEDGAVRILAVTIDRLLDSTDGGTTFAEPAGVP